MMIGVTILLYLFSLWLRETIRSEIHAIHSSLGEYCGPLVQCQSSRAMQRLVRTDFSRYSSRSVKYRHLDRSYRWHSTVYLWNRWHRRRQDRYHTRWTSNRHGLNRMFRCQQWSGSDRCDQPSISSEGRSTSVRQSFVSRATSLTSVPLDGRVWSIGALPFATQSITICMMIILTQQNECWRSEVSTPVPSRISFRIGSNLKFQPVVRPFVSNSKLL